MSDIGAFLRKLRGRMSLREAAEKSGLSHSYINSLELGKHPKTKAPISPSPESLKRLSEAYNYPYDDLLKRAGHFPEEEQKKKEELDALRQELIEEFNRLSKEDQQYVVGLIKKIRKE